MNWLMTADGRVLNLSMVRQFVPVQEENWKILCWFLEGEEPDEIGGSFLTKEDATSFLVRLLEKCGDGVCQPFRSTGLELEETQGLLEEALIASMAGTIRRWCAENLGNQRPEDESIEALATKLYKRVMSSGMA